MYEKKKKAVVPRLRFPEFRDAGEWEVKRLGGDGRKDCPRRNAKDFSCRILERRNSVDYASGNGR